MKTLKKFYSYTFMSKFSRTREIESSGFTWHVDTNYPVSNVTGMWGKTAPFGHCVAHKNIVDFFFSFSYHL